MTRWPVVALFTVLLLLLVQCGKSSSPAQSRVVGIGDSMLRVAGADVHGALDHGYNDTLIATSGKRIDQMLPDFQAAVHRELPEAVIENLGTNNAIQARRYKQSTTDFDQLLAITKAVPCVVLTTVWTDLDTTFGGTVARVINARIVQLHRQEPRKYQVVDWNALLHEPDGLLHFMALPPHETSVGRSGSPTSMRTRCRTAASRPATAPSHRASGGPAGVARARDQVIAGGA